MINLNKILDDKIDDLNKQIQKVANERDSSATPMESHHDQTRQLADQLCGALKTELRKLINLKKRVVGYKSAYFEYPRKLMVVPDGLGGVEVDGVLLVGESTPLAKKLINE